MDSSPSRSASVTAAATVAILASVFFLLACSAAFLAFLLVKLPDTTTRLPPAVRTIALAGQGFMICLSLFGLATGIGLLYLRKWARISILIWGGCSVFFGIIGIPIAYFAGFSPPSNAPALPAESMQMVRVMLLFIYGLPLVTGIWWLILFNRKSVKAQFSGAAVPSEAALAQKLKCPLPIAVLAWLYISSLLNLLFLPLVSFRVPLFLFGQVLPERIGAVVFLLSSLALAVAGIGLLKVKPWSYSLTLGLQLFWILSGIVTAMNKSYAAVMDSYMKQFNARLHLPESQFTAFSFAHSFNWIMVLSLFFAAAILAMLVYYRSRFLEAASRAASVSMITPSAPPPA